jgi:hypothetical protein
LASDATTARVTVPLTVPLRALPVDVSDLNPSPSLFDIVRQGAVAVVVTSFTQYSPDQSSKFAVALDATVSGLTAGDAVQLRVNFGGALLIDAEIYG